MDETVDDRINTKERETKANLRGTATYAAAAAAASVAGFQSQRTKGLTLAIPYSNVFFN